MNPQEKAFHLVELFGSVKAAYKHVAELLKEIDSDKYKYFYFRDVQYELKKMPL